MNFIVKKLDEFGTFESKLICPTHGVVEVVERAKPRSYSSQSNKGFGRGKFHGKDESAKEGTLSCGCKYNHEDLIGFKELKETFNEFCRGLDIINEAFDDVKVDEKGGFECSDDLMSIYNLLSGFDAMKPWIEFKIPFNHENLELIQECLKKI